MTKFGLCILQCLDFYAIYKDLNALCKGGTMFDFSIRSDFWCKFHYIYILPHETAVLDEQVGVDQHLHGKPTIGANVVRAHTCCACKGGGSGH